MEVKQPQLKIKNELCEKPVMLGSEQVGFIQAKSILINGKCYRKWFVYGGAAENPVELAGGFSYYTEAVNWVKTCDIEAFEQYAPSAEEIWNFPPESEGREDFSNGSMIRRRILLVGSLYKARYEGKLHTVYCKRIAGLCLRKRNVIFGKPSIYSLP